MFKSPLKWVSSSLISKLLSPYINQVNLQQFDYSLLQGYVILKNIQLNPNIFIRSGLKLEILNSNIEEIKIQIPWRNLYSQEIIILIKGLTLYVQNNNEITPDTIEDFEKELNDFKIESLKKFEEEMMKQNEEQNDNWAMKNILIKLIQNLKFILEDINISVIYHISSSEVVKVFVGLKEFKIIKNPSSNSINKNLVIDGLVLDLKLTEDSKFQNISTIHQHKFTLLESMSIKSNIIVTFDEKVNVEANVDISPVCLNLNQKQIRLIMRALDDIAYQDKDRPKVKPTNNKSVALWWKFIYQKVVNQNNIQRASEGQFSAVIQAGKYQKTYIKKIVDKDQLTEKETKFLIEYETNNNLKQILFYRSSAFQKVYELKKMIQKGMRQKNLIPEKNKAILSVFDNNEGFQEKISSMKMNRQKILKQQNKGRNTNFIKISQKFAIKIKYILISIEENQVIKQLISLHNQLNLFKEDLKQKSNLKQDIINHIQNQFIQKINNNKISPKAQFQVIERKILFTLQINSILIENHQFIDDQIFKFTIQNANIIDGNLNSNIYFKVLDIVEPVKFIFNKTKNEKSIKANIPVIQLVLCKPFIERISINQFTRITYSSNIFQHGKEIQCINQNLARQIYQRIYKYQKTLEQNRNIPFPGENQYIFASRLL